jgi:pullulanase/glycogen debranching enzyme
MAGNIKSFPMVDMNGASITAGQLDYFGAPGAYGERPDDSIQYISVHDDMDLFDAINVKLSQSASTADHVRMQKLGLSILALSQGIPFFHGGDDILRSRSADRNAYDAGDWFNRIDWTLQTNNWGVGLPQARDNGNDWGVLSPLLADPHLKPSTADMQSTFAHFEEMLKIRSSSRLFRLRTAADIKKMVKFYNQGPSQIPGLIVERIVDDHDCGGDWGQAAILVNATPVAQTFQADDFRKQHLKLHPQLRRSSDPVVRTSTFDKKTGRFTIPARTTAVFIGDED